MFRKSTIIKGLTLLLVVEVLVGVGLGMEWKSIVSEKQTANREQKEVEEATVKVKQTQTVVQEEPEANRIAREIIEDYNKKMADILETYREKSKPIREKIEFLITKANEMWKMGDEAEYYRLNEELDKLLKKEYQLQLWKEEQERLLKQERERREEEFAKKYLENYISKEILFLPWGSGEGEVGLKETQIMVQGIAPKTVRYGPSKLEVDKEGNIFIFDEINKRIQKYSEKKKRLSSISLSEAKKEPALIERFETNYRYETYITNKEEAEREIKAYRRALRIIDNKTGKIIGTIDYQGLDDWETGLASPLGNDDQGNIYVLVDNTGPKIPPLKFLRLKVNKYNNKDNA